MKGLCAAVLCCVHIAGSVRQLAAELQMYHDAHRKEGSQSEVPKVLEHEDGRLAVSGYQKFTILHNGDIRFQAQPEKFKFISKLFRQMHTEDKCDSLIDFGCNSGLVSLIADRQDFRSISSFDHDPTYVATLGQIIKSRGVRSIVPRTLSFGENTTAIADVVFAGAIIHWVFCLTADYQGDFGKVLDYLVSKATKYLVMEWVDPQDNAIKTFGHIRKCANGNEMVSRYTRSNFEAALRQYGVVQSTFGEKSTRTIYAVRLKSGLEP